MRDDSLKYSALLVDVQPKKGDVPMHAQTTLVKAHQGHVNALIAKHAYLSHLIDEEEQHAFKDDLRLTRLKRERLRLKESIEGI